MCILHLEYNNDFSSVLYWIMWLSDWFFVFIYFIYTYLIKKRKLRLDKTHKNRFSNTIAKCPIECDKIPWIKHAIHLYLKKKICSFSYFVNPHRMKCDHLVYNETFYLGTNCCSIFIVVSDLTEKYDSFFTIFLFIVIIIIIMKNCFRTKGQYLW